MGAHKVKIDSCDGALLTEYSGTIVVTISQILMECSQVLVHYIKVGQNFKKEKPSGCPCLWATTLLSLKCQKFNILIMMFSLQTSTNHWGLFVQIK